MGILRIISSVPGVRAAGYACFQQHFCRGHRTYTACSSSCSSIYKQSAVPQVLRLQHITNVVPKSQAFRTTYISSNRYASSPRRWKPFSPIRHLCEVAPQPVELEPDTEEQPEAHGQPEPRQEMVVTVYATYLGKDIDLQRACKAIPGGRVMDKDYAILPMQSTDPSVRASGFPQALVFRFGSMACFQLETSKEPLRKLKKDLKPFIAEAASGMGVEEAVLVWRPSQKEWIEKETDKYVVKCLDAGTLEVMSRVVAQSVALQHFTSEVDKNSAFVDEVTESAIKRELNPRKVTSEDLVARVLKSDKMLSQLITKLGVLEISRTAWQSDQYDKVWQCMREDFEIEQRLEGLKIKLEHIKESVKFILEVRHDKTSVRGENIIIALIFVEVLIALIDHGWIQAAIDAVASVTGAAK